MNCKPDDLVRYVGRIRRPNLYGWIGRTVKLISISDGDRVWVVDPPLPGGVVFYEGRPRRPEWVYDASLRPIRDPGDDAIDEMVLIVGKPEGVTA